MWVHLCGIYIPHAVSHLCGRCSVHICEHTSTHSATPSTDTTFASAHLWCVSDGDIPHLCGVDGHTCMQAVWTPRCGVVCVHWVAET